MQFNACILGWAIFFQVETYWPITLLILRALLFSTCINWDHFTGLHVEVFIGWAFIQLAGKWHGHFQLQVTFVIFSSMQWKNRKWVCYQLEISVPIYLSDHQISFYVISLSQTTVGTYPKNNLKNQYIELEDQDSGYAQSSSPYLGALVKEQMSQKTNAHLHPYTKHNHRTKTGEAPLNVNAPV